MEVQDERGARSTKTTLCCSKTQENMTYTYVKPHFVVLDVVRDLPASVPLHFVLGDRDDLV